MLKSYYLKVKVVIFTSFQNQNKKNQTIGKQTAPSPEQGNITIPYYTKSQGVELML
jgi:hypothetical protein